MEVYGSRPPRAFWICIIAAVILFAISFITACTGDDDIATEAHPEIRTPDLAFGFSSLPYFTLEGGIIIPFRNATYWQRGNLRDTLESFGPSNYFDETVVAGNYWTGFNQEPYFTPDLTYFIPPWQVERSINIRRPISLIGWNAQQPQADTVRLQGWITIQQDGLLDRTSAPFVEVGDQFNCQEIRVYHFGGTSITIEFNCP